MGQTFAAHRLAGLVRPMTPEEYTTLARDIRERGLRTPIVLYDGQILDGRHRYRACLDLGIPIRTTTFAGTEDEAKAFVYSENYARRHLSSKDRKDMIDAELKRDPSQSDRAIAEKAKVHHETVGTARKRLESAGEVAKSATIVGKDGVKQPRAKAKPAVAAPITQRLDELRLLASEGHNGEQIAARFGVCAEYLRRLARRHRITIAADVVTGRGTPKIVASRVVVETVNALAGIAHGIKLVRGGSLDIAQADAAAMLHEVKEALRQINWLVTQLKESTHG